MQYDICDLPTFLHTYDLELVEDLRWPNTNEECYVCRRVYGHLEKPYHEAEVPCVAVALQPCNHLIGHACLIELLSRGTDVCQLCRTPIRIKKHGFPEWFRHVVNTWWFSGQVQLSCWRASPQFHQDFVLLRRRLFEGSLTLQEAFWLWAYHLRGTESLAIHILEHYYCSFFGSMVFDWILSPYILETQLINAVFGLPKDYWTFEGVPALFFDITLINLIGVFAYYTFPQYIRWSVFLGTSLVFRLWMMSLGCKGLLIAMSLNTLAYGMVALVVILRARVLIHERQARQLRQA